MSWLLTAQPGDIAPAIGILAFAFILITAFLCNLKAVKQ